MDSKWLFSMDSKWRFLPDSNTILNDHGKTLPIVNFQFTLDEPVETKLYEYLNS
jgi:hypothetical protein